MLGFQLGEREKSTFWSVCESKGFKTLWDLAKLDTEAFDNLWDATKFDAGKGEFQLALTEAMANAIQQISVDMVKLKDNVRQIRTCTFGVFKAQIMPASKILAQIKADLQQFELSLETSELPESVGKLLFQKQAALDAEDYTSAERLKKEIKEARLAGSAPKPNRSDFDKRVETATVRQENQLSSISPATMEKARGVMEYSAADVVFLASSPVDDLTKKMSWNQQT